MILLDGVADADESGVLEAVAEFVHDTVAVVVGGRVDVAAVVATLTLLLALALDVDTRRADSVQVGVCEDVKLAVGVDVGGKVAEAVALIERDSVCDRDSVLDAVTEAVTLDKAVVETVGLFVDEGDGVCEGDSDSDDDADADNDRLALGVVDAVIDVVGEDVGVNDAVAVCVVDGVTDTVGDVDGEAVRVAVLVDDDVSETVLVTEGAAVSEKLADCETMGEVEPVNDDDVVAVVDPVRVLVAVHVDDDVREPVGDETGVSDFDADGVVDTSALAFSDLDTDGVRDSERLVVRDGDRDDDTDALGDAVTVDVAEVLMVREGVSDGV